MSEKDYVDIKFKLFEALSKHKDAMNILCKYSRQEVGLMCHKVIEKQIEFYGGINDRVIESYATLAGILEQSGNFTEAESILKQTLEFYQQVLDKNHPIIYSQLAHLAFLKHLIKQQKTN